MKRTMVVLAVLGLVSGVAEAGVKVSATTVGRGVGQAASAQSITYVQGNKMRTETTVGGREMVTIIDLDAQKMYSLDPAKREGDVYSLAALRAEMERGVGVSAGDAKVTMKPNGKKKTVMDVVCDGYDVSITIPTNMGGAGELVMVLGGPAWIAKNVPGAEEYAAFFKAAGEKGMFFNNAQQAKTMPAQAKGMAELYRIVAATGMPLEQEIAIKVDGTGPLAGMMGKMANASIGTSVNKVTKETLPDELFGAPAGYKLKNR